MKKILLISPPAYGLKDKLAYPPLGLLYLASNLEGEYFIEVKNMVNLSEDIRYDYDIFGVSIHGNASYEPAKAIMSKLREMNQKALIVTGGSFPTNMAEFVLKNTEADIVVIGEGERTFSCICRGDNSRDIKGIAYKDAQGIYLNAPQELIKDLNTLKFPARHLLPRYMIRHEGKVHHSDKPATTIFATRGCVYNCTFCDTNLWRRRWRTRSPENIIAEIEEVIRDYDIHWFRFPDDSLNIDKGWFAKFCSKLARCNIEWTMLSRSDKVDLETLKLMKTSGCREVFFGFESGSQKLLDMMKKNITVEQNIRAVELCREAGITSCAYMMFGFPGEDEKTVEETKQFLLKARPDKSRLAQFIPIPGSDVWRNPDRYKVRLKENFSEHWVFDSPDFALEYDYIGNDKMELLREDIINFYKEQGYFEKWDKAT